MGACWHVAILSAPARRRLDITGRAADRPAAPGDTSLASAVRGAFRAAQARACSRGGRSGRSRGTWSHLTAHNVSDSQMCGRLAASQSQWAPRPRALLDAGLLDRALQALAQRHLRLPAEQLRASAMSGRRCLGSSTGSAS